MAEICPVDLTKKKCKPCEGGVSPLSSEEVSRYLGQVRGWEPEENKKIKKEFRFKDFVEAMEFVNKVAGIAQEEGHHPSIFISYNKVKITLATHSIGGLSDNDFIMAAKIDAA